MKPQHQKILLDLDRALAEVLLTGKLMMCILIQVVVDQVMLCLPVHLV